MPKCVADGCDVEIRYVDRMCKPHYRGHYKARVAKLAPVCTVNGCHLTARSLGAEYCEKHYGRVRRNGDPHAKLIDTTHYIECQYCGVATSGGHKHCSGRCKTRACRGVASAKPCDYCGKPFTSPTNTTSCSSACHRGKKRAYARDYRIRRMAEDPAYRDAERTYEYKRRARKVAVTVEEFSREEVFDRDGWVCQICNKLTNQRVAWPHPKFPTLDHIIPLSKGGEHSRRNTQTAHLRCNLSKGDRSVGSQLLLVG